MSRCINFIIKFKTEFSHFEKFIFISYTLGSKIDWMKTFFRKISKSDIVIKKKKVFRNVYLRFYSKFFLAFQQTFYMCKKWSLVGQYIAKIFMTRNVKLTKWDHRNIFLLSISYLSLKHSILFLMKNHKTLMKWVARLN